MTKRPVYAIVVVFLSLVMTLVGNTLYTIHYVSQSEKQICGVLNVSTQPRPQPPTNPTPQPTTPYGKELLRYNQQMADFENQAVQEIKNLSERYDCP